MKAQILKIAGVKSEKEFYKKYPSEEAFMKVHGKAFKKAQTSNAVEKAQFGLLQPAGTTYGTPQQQLSQSAGAAVNTFQQNNPIGTAAAAAGGGGGPLGFLGGLFGGGAGGAGGFNPLSTIPIAGSAFGVIDSFINSKKKRDVARQNAALTSVQAQASETRAEDPTRNYNFPQVGLSGGMGMGTNPLARDGAEIQNTHAPGTLYDDLGYEPLNDPEEVKAYAYGGGIRRAQSGDSAPLIPYSNEYLEGLENDYMKLYNDPNISMDDGYDAFYHSMIDSLPDVTKKAKGWIEYKPGQEEDGYFTEDDGYNTVPTPRKGRMIKRVEDYETSDKPDTVEQANLAKYIQLRAFPNLDNRTVSTKAYGQMAYGGDVPRAQSGFTQFMKNRGSNILSNQLAASNDFNTGSQLGGLLGDVGNFIVPGSSMITKPLLTGVMGALDPIANETKGYKREAQRNQDRIMASQFANSNAAMNASYMEDGGWVSHDWQPQVIASFGGHSMKDLLAPDKTMDTLRTGGNIKQNNMFPQDRYAFGGQMTVEGNGGTELVGYNPVTASKGISGETRISTGASHDEQDRTGKFTIMNYGGKKVNIENNETIMEQQEDGGEIDPMTGKPNASAVVLGDMYIGEVGKNVLGQIDKKLLKGKDVKDIKFKHLGNTIAKEEGKLNKAEQKYTSIASSVKGNSPSDMLKLKTAEVARKGIEMSYADLDGMKSKLSDIQNTYHDVAEANGYDDTPKFLEDLKKNKFTPLDVNVDESMYAQKGKKIRKKKGKVQPQITPLPKDAVRSNSDFSFEDVMFKEDADPRLGTPSPYVSSQTIPQSRINQITKLGKMADIPESARKKETKEEKKKDNTNNRSMWMDVLSEMVPYLRPTNQEDLDPRQLYGENFIMSSNQIQPVGTQSYQPMLPTRRGNISMQDQLNENTAAYRAAQRQLGYNPAAQANLAAQMYGANSKVLADQMRLNQEMDNKYYLDSIATMNDAQLKNISLYDAQQQRQNQAISNTRDATLAALNSYSDKIVKNTASNRKLGIYENMYNYRFDPVTGRAINYNAPHQFNYNGVASTDKKASLPEGYEYLYDSEGNPTDVRKKKETKTKDSRNGSIVKSLKSL